MTKKGYIKTVEAIIAAGMIFIFSTILITNPLGIVRKVDLSDLKAMSADALRVADDAHYDQTRTYMEHYLSESRFPPTQGDPMLQGLYDAIGEGLPENVGYQLSIEGTNNLGEGATVTIGPAPQASDVVTASYMKSMAGFLSAAQFPPIGVLAAVDDQVDIDFLCSTVSRAQELYPDIQLNFTLVNVTREGGTGVILKDCSGSDISPVNFNDFNGMMTGDYFVYLFEDLQRGNVPPGLTWNEYKSDIQCIGNTVERKKGIILGASTLYYTYDRNQGWNEVSGILALTQQSRNYSETSCSKITNSLLYKVPLNAASTPPTSDDNTAFVRDFKIAQYHFITRDFFKGDIVRYNDLWKNTSGIPIFIPASRPSYWPTIDTGDGCTDDFWCRGLFTTYVSYDVSKDAAQGDREVWYELATNNNIEGTWDPDHLLPKSPTACTGYDFRENRAAILKQIMPENASYCGKPNLCGRYALNLIRLGRAWDVYMLYYQNWGQIKEPDSGGNGQIDTARLVDDVYDSNLDCQPSCGVGSTVDPGVMIMQPGPNGILDSITGGDDQEVRDTGALTAAKNLETLMFEEIVWASFWDTPFEYRVYKITLLTWYKGSSFELLAEERRWFFA